MKTKPALSLRLALLSGLTVLLTACSSGPKPADWQVEAKDSMERSIKAYMEGNNRVEAAELARARNQLSRTGRADLLRLKVCGVTPPLPRALTPITCKAS